MINIFSNSVVLYSAIDVLAKVVQFLFFPLLAQFLNIEQLAILSLYLIAVTASQPVLTLSTIGSFSLFYNKKLETKFDDSYEDRLFFSAGLISLISTSVFYCLFLLIPDSESSIEKYNFGYIFFIAVFAEFVVMLIFVKLRLGFHKYQYSALFMLYMLLKFILAFIFIQSLNDSKGYLYAISVSSLCVFLAYTYKNGCRIKLLDKTPLLKLLLYSKSMVPIGICSILLVNIDKVIIGMQLSAKDIASYNALFLLMSLIQVLVMAINKSYMPKLLKEYSLNGFDALNTLLPELKKYDFIILFLSVSTFCFSYFIYGALYADKLDYNWRIAACFSITFFLNYKYVMLSNALCIKAEFVKYRMIALIVPLIIIVPISYLLTLKYNSFGAAISTSLGYIICLFVIQVIVFLKVDKNYRFFDSLLNMMMTIVLLIFLVLFDA